MEVEGIGLIAKCGRQVEFGNDELRPELLHSRDGNPQVLIFLQRRANQPLKLAILEQFPPR
jgi:hypothetical protein